MKCPSLPILSLSARYSLLRFAATLLCMVSPIAKAAELGLNASSYLGDNSSTEAVYGMAWLSDGTLVIAANIENANPGGLAPTLLNGASPASSGAILRLSGDGTTLLSVTRVGNAVYDLSIDANDALYVAAGADGLLKINPLADSLLGTALTGDFVYRVDAGPDGRACALIPDSLGDPGHTPGSSTVVVLDTTFSEINRFRGEFQNVIDVAIDEASATVYAVGFTNRKTWIPDLGSGTPVDVPALSAYPYLYGQPGFPSPKWEAYHWEADPWLDEARTVPNPRYVNYPFDPSEGNLNADRYPLTVTSNMADARGYRVEIGGDGLLYSGYEYDGGNHVFRWNPYDLTAAGTVVGGDIFHQDFNSSTVPKVFWARMNPTTGELLLSQTLTNRLNNKYGPARDNTIRLKYGAIDADSDGRVYLAGACAAGLPIPENQVYLPNPGETTFDPYGPGAYTGGAYAIVMSSNFSTRLYTTRISTSGTNHAISARILSGQSEARIAWGGTTLLKVPLFVLKAIQPDPGYGAQDATLAVLGGELFDGSNAFTFSLDFTQGLVASNSNLRNNNELRYVLDLDGDGMDDSRAGFPFSLTQPLTPTSGYSGAAVYGGFFTNGYDFTDIRLNDKRVEPKRLTIRSQPSSPDVANHHGVFFIPRSAFTGLEPGDVLDFQSGNSFHMDFAYGIGGRWRFLVRNGETFFVSEDSYSDSYRKTFDLDIDDGRWAAWAIPSDMNFDAASATFLSQNFDNITGLGFIVDTDSITSTRFFMLWESTTVEMRLNGSDNLPPIPVIQATPGSGAIPFSVNLDGTGSYDPDGIPSFFTWDFDDGNALAGPAVNHTYTVAGRFHPRLTVYDTGLAFAETSHPVQATAGLLSQPDTVFAAFRGDAVNGNTSLANGFSETVAIDDTMVDDHRFGHAFSDEIALTPGINGTRLHGFIIGESLNAPEGFNDAKIEDRAGGDVLNIRLQTDSGVLVRMRGMIYIDQSAFLNGADTAPVSFDSGSELATELPIVESIGAVRWMVRDGSTYYLSFETLPTVSGSRHVLAFTSSTDHGEWAEFDPATGAADFDPSVATFTRRTFTDVTAVGLYFEQDTFSSSRQRFQLEALEASGTFGSTATYADWASLHFSPAELMDSGLEETLWGRTADPDGHLPNILEFLFGTDPRNMDTPSPFALQRQTDGETPRYVFTFPVRHHLDGDPVSLPFIIEYSPDLGNASWAGVFDASACSFPADCTQGGLTARVVASDTELHIIEVEIDPTLLDGFLRLSMP